MSTCLNVSGCVKHIQKVLSLIKAPQGRKTIDCILNQRVDRGHQSKLQPNRVTGALQVSLADSEEVA